jgi:hypothetical protein
MPEELAAVFGNVVPVGRSEGFVEGVLAATPEELAAAFGNVAHEP